MNGSEQHLNNGGALSVAGADEQKANNGPFFPNPIKHLASCKRLFSGAKVNNGADCRS